MMIRFSGRSSKTHRIKNKPIGEGFKFFALTTSQGFVANYTSDGRTAFKSVSLMTFVKHKTRDKTATRARENERQADVDMDKFCMAMDNYFTLPQVIKRLREKVIGVVGTARMRKG
eukprot:53432-Ditylum_brightwellii.AAC.1